MTNPQRLAALALAASLAACGDDAATEAGLLLSEPSAVAVFRGNVAAPDTVQPYIAIANAGSNDLTIVDATTDKGVPAPVPLRNLVVPVPGRPMLLAAAPFSDPEPEVRPDLLVAVSAGGSALQVIRTWAVGTQPADLGIAGERELGEDVLALVAVPTAPLSRTARVAAALSGGRIAVVTFTRPTGDAIDVATAEVDVSAPLAFQAIALAAMPEDATRIWAATPDLDGVVEIGIDAGGAPSVGNVLNAGAPTRLVAAARLAERGIGEVEPDPTNLTTVNRVYAVLDESGCGLDAPIACGLVALDADGSGLAPDFANPADPRAPIPIPGRPLALAASGPPARAPSDAEADQIYADPFMRMITSAGARRTTGAAAVASADGSIYFVDLARWELPSNQVVSTSVAADVTSASDLDPAGVVTVTPGFTPTARWTVTYEGVLPGLASRRAQAGNDGSPWLALQTGSAAGFSEVVRLYDPMLGVLPGDTVVIEPANLGTCTAPFEMRVADLVAPDAATYPGGAVRLAEKDPGNAAWHACFLALGGPVSGLRATFRAGDPDDPGGSDRYVVVRTIGEKAVYAGRAKLGEDVVFQWSDEAGFPACRLPPAAPWNPAVICDAGCRSACQDLLVARLARRIGYVPEESPEVTDVLGPALAFRLALETAPPPPRDLALVIDTREGRDPARAGDPLGAALDARSAVAFDKSPYTRDAGIRFLVPYASGVVLDTSPTDNTTAALR